MSGRHYQKRTCRICKQSFCPSFPHQSDHVGCRRARYRLYQRQYQRKVRRDLKMGLVEYQNNET